LVEGKEVKCEGIALRRARKEVGKVYRTNKKGRCERNTAENRE
jgi:hypothetical protein